MGTKETRLKGRSGKCTLDSILDNFRRLGHDSAILGFNHLNDDVLLGLGRAAVAIATTVTSGVTTRVTTGVAAVCTASTLQREGAVACCRDANKQMRMYSILHIRFIVYCLMKIENLQLCFEMLMALIPLASLLVKQER